MHGRIEAAAGGPGDRGSDPRPSVRPPIVAAALLAVAVVVASGCGDAAARDTGRRETAMDSTLPGAAALERFRAGLGNPETLLHSQPGRDRLVRAFVRAVETADTAALRALALSRAEYAWLYYEHSREAAAPYELAPGLAWDLLQLRGGRGERRLLEQLGGRPLGLRAYSCEAEPAVSPGGPVRTWGPCLVRRRTLEGARVEERLFGLIVEVDGRFKFLNLSNRLD
jgi:hypothetical protein